MSRQGDQPDSQANRHQGIKLGTNGSSITNTTREIGAPPDTSSPTRLLQAIQTSSEQPPSSRTDISPQILPHSNPLPDAQPTVSPHNLNPKEALENYDWDSLEARYLAAMEALNKEEEDIGEEFRAWVKMFEAWASTTLSHEQERSHKRLRTRISFVQSKEQALEEKREHYVKVVRAFESALALLGAA